MRKWIPTVRPRGPPSGTAWSSGASARWPTGSAADMPCYGIPNDAESTLRLEHPEWVPVDRSGLLKQGGPLEFAYPAARKARWICT